MARKIKYPLNSHPNNNLGVGDWGASEAKSRTESTTPMEERKPKVTLTPGNEFTGKGNTQEVGSKPARMRSRKPGKKY